MKTVKKTILILIVLILLSFIIMVSSLNLTATELNLYFIEINASLGFVVLLVLIVGVLVGSLLTALLWLWPTRRKSRYWQRQYFRLKQDTEPSANSTQHSLENHPSNSE